MALAAGLCAGSNYFNQPLLHSMALGLGVSEALTAMSVTVAQVAYAIGLITLVPLGDMLERRRLATVLMLLAAVGQFTCGFAPHLSALLVGTAIAGLFSVAAQVLVPMAATLAEPARSGRAVGTVMSGLLIGILCARSVAGLLSSLGGWHLVYRVSGTAMLLVAALLWRRLPSSQPSASPRYGAIQRSLFTLWRTQPRLRSRALLGGLAFASVSVMFSTMTLMLSGPAHGLNDAHIGLIGLAGVAGAAMASVAGRLADKGLLQATSLACVLMLALSWLVLREGTHSLPCFIIGMLMIDLGLQGVHISNQNVVYGLLPQARSRLNALYMTSYFVGAASGSALGTWAWAQGGWPACCAMGLGLALLAGLALWHDWRLAARCG